MSRSLGLREDQREGRVLATLIFRLFPVDSVRCHREQARSYRGSRVTTGFVCPTGSNCRSEPARDGAGEVNADLKPQNRIQH